MASWWILKWTHSIFWHVHYFAPVTVGPSLHLAPGTCQTTCLIFHVAFVPSRTTCLGASKSQHVSKPWCSRKNINVEGAGSRVGPEGMKVLQTLLYIHRLCTDPLGKLILTCNGTLYCFSNIHVTSLKIFVFQRPNPMSLSIYIRSIVMKGKPMMDTDLFDSLNDSFELAHKRVHHQWNIKPSHFALDFFSAFTLNFLWLESPDVMKGLFSLQSLQRQTVSLCCHPWHCFKAVTHRGAEMWHPLTVWSDRRMDGRHGWHWLDGAGHEKDAVLFCEVQRLFDCFKFQSVFVQD